MSFAFFAAFGLVLHDLADSGLRPLFLIAIVNPCEAAVYAQLRSYVSDIRGKKLLVEEARQARFAHRGIPCIGNQILAPTQQRLA